MSATAMMRVLGVMGLLATGVSHGQTPAPGAAPPFAPAPSQELWDRLDKQMRPELVGEVLAFELLGDDELRPVRPGSVGSALMALQAFNKGGVLVPGVAVELSPSNLTTSKSITYDEYVTGSSNRMVSRASLSIAAISEGGTGPVARGAAALRFRLWDGTDWRLNREAMECALETRGGRLGPGETPSELEGLVDTGPKTPAEDAVALARCLEDNVKWNASQASVGVAASLRALRGGELEFSTADRLAAYFGASWSLGEHAQGILSARYTYEFAQQVAAQGQSALASHVGGLGLRLVYKVDSLVLSLDSGFGVRHRTNQNTLKGVLGLLVQFKVGRYAWVESGVTTLLNGPEEPSQLRFSSSLKWLYDLTPAEL